MNKLFVYGTLAPNRANEHILKPLKGNWYPAKIRGRLLPEGWGAALGYPAVIPNDDGDWIDGLIFESDELAEHWQRIDAFEGEGYQRIVVDVFLTNQDAPIQAYIYALNGSGE